MAARRALRGIETARLIMRFASPRDAQGFLRTIDDVVAQVNGWSEDDVAKVRRLTGVQLLFSPKIMIVERQSGTIVGSLSLNASDVERRSCEIGWWLGAEHRGKGYGTEAVGAAIAALHRAGVASVVIGTSPGNTAVIRVMEKLGGRVERQSLHRLPNGTLTDSLWFAFGAAPAPAG